MSDREMLDLTMAADPHDTELASLRRFANEAIKVTGMSTTDGVLAYLNNPNARTRSTGAQRDFLAETEIRHAAFRELFEEFFVTMTAKEMDYGPSWRARGGIGAFMMLARKWDRLENAMKGPWGYDILEALRSDKRSEGVRDDLKDLAIYLCLCIAEMTIEQRLGVAAHTVDPKNEAHSAPHKPSA